MDFDSVSLSWLRAPFLQAIHLSGIVNHVMTAGADAGHLVALDVVHQGGMGCSLLKVARAQMAMQALAVIERVIELDGLLRRAYVLRVNVVQAAEFGVDAAGVEGVIGVAGITSLIMGHAVILEMDGRN